MRKIRVDIEYPTGSEVEVIEVEDEATDEDIAEAAQEAFFNTCNYGWTEIDPEDSTL